MLWNASRRWSVNHSHQILHRILVYCFPPCNPRPLFSSRRESSRASASALLRVDVPIPRPGPINGIQGNPAVLQEKPEPQIHARSKQAVTRSSGPILRIPDELLQLLDEHHLYVPARFQASVLYQHVQKNQDWSRFFIHADSVACAALELARTDSPQCAFYVLQAAHQIGTTFKQNVYEGVIHALACGRQWSLVLAVVSDALGVTGRTSVRLLNWRGLALLKTQNYGALGNLLEEFEKYGLKPRQRTFLLILQGHLRNHDLARTRATIRSMETAGFPMDESTFNVIVPAYRGFGLDDFVMERGYGILNSNQPMQNREKILHGLLRLHLDNHDIQGALKLLETFSSRQKHPEDSTNHGESYVGGADKKKEKTLEDHATYSILINYLSKYGPDSLSGILGRMRDHGGTPDIKISSALIRMHYLRGEEHDALVVLRDCCHHYDLRLDELKHLGYDPQRSGSSDFAPFKGYPTTELFNSVLHGAIQIRGLGAAVPVLKLMNDAKLKPDTRTLDILLFYLSKERLQKKRRIQPRHFVQVMQRLQSADVQPTLATLNIIFQFFVERTKYSRQGKGIGALKRYANRTKQALRFPDKEKLPMLRELRLVPTFDAELCVADLQDNALSEVLQVVQALRDRRVLADRATFAIRMKYDTLSLRPRRAPEAVAQHLQIMRGRGLYPNVYHYAALMEAYCVAGNMQAAEDILQDTVKRGLVPLQKSHVVLHTVLISAYSRSGRPDLALKTFHEMLNAGVPPDVASVDALVGAFYAARAKRLARRVLLDVWPMVAPFPVELREAKLPELIARLREIGARAEAPNSDVERRTIRSRREWRDLSKHIIAEWRRDGGVHVHNEIEDDEDHDHRKDSGNDV